MPRKVRKPLTSKNRETDKRKNYLRARDASRSRSGVRKNGRTARFCRNANDFSEIEIDSMIAAHSCGALDIVCQHCNALRWIGEKTTFCCQDGKVTGKDRNPSPSTTTTLKYYDVQQSGRLFLAHIRKYNNALALASIGCKKHVRDGFNSTFTIQGKLYHRMGNLLPERGETPKFSQTYFHDSDIDKEVDNRLTHAELDRHILQELQSTLQTLCKFVSQKSFKTAIEVGVEQLVLHADNKTTSRRTCQNLQLTSLQRSRCSFTR